ncbi:MAG TPA: PIN domain-containing protein [Gammaproteobacteria bacterium]|nr:PIN domain-containing protein [Gammaproteobacteria bacterium]
MKILFDTNIILDLLLDRAPFAEHAQLLFEKIESGVVEGYLPATTITTLDYLLMKALTAKDAAHIIKKIMKLFEIAPINRLILEDALDSGFQDFEDAVLHASAVHCGAQAIVTRDESGFSKTRLAIYSPEALLNVLSLKKDEHHK